MLVFFFLFKFIIIVKLNYTNFCTVITKDSICVGAARIGWPDQKIIACTLDEMVNVNLGPPLHSLVIVGTLHELEEQFLKQFYINNK